MESKKYNKLVNVTRSRLTDIENKLVVTSGEVGEGQHGGGSGRDKILGVGQATGM